MNITVDSSFHPDNALDIISLIEYTSERLMPEIANELVIDVRLEDQSDYEAVAEVDPIDQDINHPRIFIITVDKGSLLDTGEMLTSVAHEMVHIKQYAKNELKQRDGYMSYRRKRFYYSKASLAEYYNFPWEIEAYGLEKGLYHGWKENQQFMDFITNL